ncbi:MAG: 3-deoxy-manno-octulosonate cytidylyltransferase [Pseudomonadales bacterium]
MNRDERCIIGVVPVRMGSTRFPGKPLALIHGMPMIGHVWFRCRQSKLLDAVYIATCDQEIADYASSIGAPCIMTKDTHERCTERTAEAVSILESRGEVSPDIVVMIQGDEPMTTPEMIDTALAPMLNEPSIQVVNLMAPIATAEEHADPNEIKVVTDLASNALYFSRQPIPTRARAGQAAPPISKQVCVIPFRRDFLLEFDTLAPTPLEIAESIDMLRVLEHGRDVRMAPTDAVSFSVDTESDRQRVERAMTGDPLMASYL